MAVQVTNNAPMSPFDTGARNAKTSTGKQLTESSCGILGNELIQQVKKKKILKMRSFTKKPTAAPARREQKKKEKKDQRSRVINLLLTIYFQHGCANYVPPCPTFRYVSLFDYPSSPPTTYNIIYIYFFSFDSFRVFFFCSTATAMITICYVLYCIFIEPNGEQQTMSALILRYELRVRKFLFLDVVCCQPI